MMRGLRSTTALLVVALGLGAYIYFVESERPPGGTPDPLETVFDFESDDITGLSVTAESGDRTVLEKTDGRWQLVEPFAGTVDVTEVVAMSSSLAALEMQRVVAEPEETPDLTVFGLLEPRIEVAITTTTGVDARLLVGVQTPTGGDLYATVAGSNRVFLISGYLDSTFNRTTFDLRDKTILNFTRDQVDSLEITGADLAIRLQQVDNRWSLVRPIEAHADLGVTDGLVGRLSTGQMAAIEAESTDALEPYGLDAPRVTVTVGLGGSAATLLIGDATPAGTVYARDAARELVFTIDESLLAELEQGVDEYRRKNLFAFRPFNATVLEVDRDDERWVYEKVDAPADDEADRWRRTAPGDGDVEQSAMDDLLSKLSNLRAESFVASRDGTGLDAPPWTILVTFDEDGTQERVVVGRVVDDVFAVTGDEPGAAHLNTRAWDEALEALDALE
jgi:hypothetical protein